MTTSELRKKHNLSRRDAIACKKHGSDVNAYKGSKEYQDRAARRAKQGDGIGAKPRLCGWSR